MSCNIIIIKLKIYVWYNHHAQTYVAFDMDYF